MDAFNVHIYAGVSHTMPTHSSGRILVVTKYYLVLFQITPNVVTACESYIYNILS